MNKEESILISNIEDKIEKCISRYTTTKSNFLDLNQRSLAEHICNYRKDFFYLFYGGYEDAERTIVIFSPEHIDLEQDNPLEILRVHHNGHNNLTHRDYLGSLMGLGIKREMIGDILVRNDGADIIILKEVSTFLQQNYTNAGNASLGTGIYTIEELMLPEAHFKEKTDTVASLRIDSIIASIFSLSRTKSQEAIKAGLVFVNSKQCIKADYLINEGDKIVLRGKGKAVLSEIGKTTRKNRTVIVSKKYL